MTWLAAIVAGHRSAAQSRRSVCRLKRNLRSSSSLHKKSKQIQKLLSPLFYFSNALRAEPAILNTNTLGQPGLWSFGISGDYPILLVRMKREEDLDLLGELFLAHTYWRKRGLMIDLVIFNQRETSYDQDFKSRIYRLLEHTASETWLNKRGGIFILQEDQMNEAERILLMTVARVVLDGEAGPLERQLAKLDADPVRLPRFTAHRTVDPGHCDHPTGNPAPIRPALR